MGAAAGAAGLTLGGHNVGAGTRPPGPAQKGRSLPRSQGQATALKTAVSGEKLATGLMPLEVAGLTGEIAATKILHGDTKRKPARSVKKDPARSSEIG